MNKDEITQEINKLPKDDIEEIYGFCKDLLEALDKEEENGG